MIFLSGSARLTTNVVQIGDKKSHVHVNLFVFVQKGGQFTCATRTRANVNVCRYMYTQPLPTTGYLSFFELSIDIFLIIYSKLSSSLIPSIKDIFTFLFPAPFLSFYLLSYSPRHYRYSRLNKLSWSFSFSI